MQLRDTKPAFLLMTLLLTVWLGFLVHRSPRFAGSPWGGLLATSGAALMLVPLAAYMLIKRAPFLRSHVTPWVSISTLLSIHVYTSLLGAILVLLHTGHKFDSPLGMALTASLLLVVASGFVGRYLMSHISQNLREKRDCLHELEQAYESARAALAQRLGSPAPAVAIAAATDDLSPATLSELAGGIADLEYAIAVHDRFKSLFLRWLTFHRTISAILCILLALHVAAGIYYGLRWFA